MKNRDSCGGKQDVQRKEIKNRRTSRLTDSDVATRGSGGQIGSRSEKEEVEKQLLSLSVSPQTKLLVSPDSQQLWFDQVSPPTLPIAGQQLCSDSFHIVVL